MIQPEIDLLVLGMGGTIDKDYPRSTMGYAFEIDEPAAERILAAMPFCSLRWSIQSICKKDSTEINDRDRELLVEAIRSTTASKVLVTHGTDTMIETAQFVKRSRASASCAVAFTGAMKPERFYDSDATFNVGVAVGALGLISQGEVVVCMGGKVLEASKCVRDLTTGLFNDSS